MRRVIRDYESWLIFLGNFAVVLGLNRPNQQEG